MHDMRVALSCMHNMRIINETILLNIDHPRPAGFFLPKVYNFGHEAYNANMRLPERSIYRWPPRHVNLLLQHTQLVVTNLWENVKTQQKYIFFEIVSISLKDDSPSEWYIAEFNIQLIFLSVKVGYNIFSKNDLNTIDNSITNKVNSNCINSENTI